MQFLDLKSKYISCAQTMLSPSDGIIYTFLPVDPEFRLALLTTASLYTTYLPLMNLKYAKRSSPNGVYLTLKVKSSGSLLIVDHNLTSLKLP